MLIPMAITSSSAPEVKVSWTKGSLSAALYGGMHYLAMPLVGIYPKDNTGYMENKM